MRSTLAFVVASAFAAVASVQGQTLDLTQLLANQTNLTEFNTLVHNYGDIYAALSFSKNVTIFAPSDSAFQKIPYSSLGTPFETNNSDIVRAVLKYHVVNGTHPSSSLNSSFQFLPTWLNNQTYANVTGGQTVGVVEQAGDSLVCVSGLGSRSTITTKDIPFQNGIVHIIDSFFIPPLPLLNTVQTFNLTGFGGAVVNASLDTSLDTKPDLTIFAPNNAAFQTIGSSLTNMTVADLSQILNYHVVNSSGGPVLPNSNQSSPSFVGYSTNLANGTTLRSVQGGKLSITFASNSIFVNSARILQQDLLLSNGVLHVIDNLLDPAATAATPDPALPTQPPVVHGSSVADVPFSSDLPTTLSSFGAASSVPTDASSSFAVSDMGSSATSTTESAASATSSKKSAATGRPRVEGRGVGLGALVGALVLAV